MSFVIKAQPDKVSDKNDIYSLHHSLPFTQPSHILILICNGVVWFLPFLFEIIHGSVFGNK